MAKILSLAALREVRGLKPAPHIMSNEPTPTKVSYLAQVRQNGKEVLVLAMPAGQTTTIVFDEFSSDPAATMMVSTESAAPALISRISDNALLPNSKEQYLSLWGYVTQEKLPAHGPLLMARAALAMREKNLTPYDAIMLAAEQGKDALNDQRQDIQDLRDLELI